MDYSPKPTKKYIEKINLSKTINRSEKSKKRYIYWRGFYDDNFFINYFLWHYKVDKLNWTKIKDSKLHNNLRELLSSKENAVICFPRDFAKSTNSFFIIIKKIVYKIDKQVLLIMWEWLWWETIWKVRAEFEDNKRIFNIFWRLVPNRTTQEANKVRAQKKLDFLNGVSISTISNWWKVRWRRPTIIIVDDPQENDDVVNPVITTKFNKRFLTTVIPTLDPTGCCKVIGTNVWELSLVNFLLKNDRKFKAFEFKAIENPIYEDREDKFWNPTINLIWWQSNREGKRTIEALNEKLLIMWFDYRQQEYMNIPAISSWKPVFDLEIVKLKTAPKPIEISSRYNWLAIYKAPCECSRWIDLSLWWSKWDFTTMVARDYDYNLIFVYQWRSLWYELMDIIDYLDERWYFWIKVFERNFWTAQAIFDMAQDKTRYSDIYRQKTSGTVWDKETLNLWRNTTRQSKEKMVWRMQLVIKWYEDTYWQKHHIQDIDEREKREIEKFYLLDNNKMEALPNYHDDLVIADALCLQWLKEFYGILMDI